MAANVNGATPTPTGAYAPVNGLRLYYEVHGAGSPLVLLHGGLLTIDSTFGPIIPSLAKTHKVIAVELQGHGHTADIDREFTLDNLADDLVELLGQLGIDQAAFFGFSLGGLVAMNLVTRHPNVVSRLVLASVHFRPDGYHPEIRDPEAHPGSKRMPTASDFQAMQDTYRRVAPDPDHFAKFAAKASATVAAVKGWSAHELGAIRVPTLVLVGDTDFVLVQHAVEMFELIPNAQLAVLPGATHMDLTRRGDQVLAMVAPFLAAST